MIRIYNIHNLYCYYNYTTGNFQQGISCEHKLSICADSTYVVKQLSTPNAQVEFQFYSSNPASNQCTFCVVTVNELMDDLRYACNSKV